MTADDITRRLIADLMKSGATVLPRFTPRHWWECDVAEVTKAGYLREYEIKVSRSDYKIDREKSKSKWDPATHQSITRNKHEQLRAHDMRGPKQFYFVFPAGMMSDAEVPPWAGYFTAEEWKSHRPPWNVRLVCVRRAPILHSILPYPEIRNQMMTAAYWRFLRATYSGNAPIAGDSETENKNEYETTSSTQPA